jgi:hypothetical protein
VSEGKAVSEGNPVQHRSRFARHLCVAVDATGYGGRDNVAQYDVQSHLLKVLDEAATAAGLDRSQWCRQLQGDAEIALLPPDQPEPRVVDDFIRELDAALDLLNHERRLEARLRLRVAVHFGVAYEAPSGFAGQAVVVTARLLNSADLHRALAEADDADIAVALSDRVYMETVLNRHTSLRPRQFVRAEVAEKEYRGAAWIRVLFRNTGVARGNGQGDLSAAEPGEAHRNGSAQLPAARSATAGGVQNRFYGDVDAGVIGINITEREWRQ